MENTPGIIEKVSSFACEYIRNNMPDEYVFHKEKHTKIVVETALEIADGSGISDEEREILEIAAWFHDTGYAITYKGHEAESIRIATEFLAKEGYPEDKINAVANCIKATQMPQSPNTLIEKIICDADLSNFGRKNFFERDDLVRAELEAVKQKKYTDTEWWIFAKELLQNHTYHTEYAREKFNKKKEKNILTLEGLIAGKEEKPKKKKDKKGKKDKKSTKDKIEKPFVIDTTPPRRGVETMFRNSLRGHLQLSAIADSKANIMQSVNAIIISIIIPMLMPRLSEDTYLVWPTGAILLVSILTIIFATISTIPKVTEGTFSKEDIKNKNANLLFFGNFHNMELDDFEWGMKEMMKDKEFLYSSMIKDFYFLGKVLSKKYKYLRISYSIFMIGMTLVVIAFVIAYFIHMSETQHYIPNT